MSHLLDNTKNEGRGEEVSVDHQKNLKKSNLTREVNHQRDKDKQEKEKEN